ncbi:TetR/AcrR family transcriptional regulator [Bacillus sp. SCS-151]|uniref:TetR/AcrR family transcriptional regulator n=1 Tax=Nanhaiella sioensis TaxID=3115293 RepID=UPI00397BC181
MISFQNTKINWRDFLKFDPAKSFDSIIIQNIADEAMINRATFYLHYQDKYDLLDHMIEHVLLEVEDVYDPTNHIKNKLLETNKLQATILRVFEHVEKHRFFYQVMFGEHGCI